MISFEEACERVAAIPGLSIEQATDRLVAMVRRGQAARPGARLGGPSSSARRSSGGRSLAAQSQLVRQRHRAYLNQLGAVLVPWRG